MSQQYSSLWSQMIKDFSNSDSSFRGYKTYTSSNPFFFLIIIFLSVFFGITCGFIFFVARVINLARRACRKSSRLIFGSNSYLFNFFDWRTILAICYISVRPQLYCFYIRENYRLFRKLPLPSYNSIKLFIAARSIADFCLANSYKPITVLEIGAGTGDFAKLLAHLIPSIQEYVIVDLPEMLEVSRAFLDASTFKPSLTSLKPEEFSSDLLVSNQLIINIESFAEMSSPVYTNYISVILRYLHHSSLFYSNNREMRFHSEHSPLKSDSFSSSVFAELSPCPLHISSSYSNFRDFVFSYQKRNICAFISR